MDRLRLINTALDRRFPEGRDPFKMVARLAEEVGELAREVNHFEGAGIKAEKHGAPDKHRLAREVRDVLLSALQILDYYGAGDALEQEIAQSIARARAEGLIE